MKKILSLLLAAFLLAGCQSANGGEELPAETTAPTVETTAAPVETTAAPTETDSQEETTMPILPLNPIISPTLPVSGERLAFSNPGSVRIAYTGNVNYVKYITSADQLPNEAALKGYDPAFFENHALLLLVETVPSGSMRLEIEAIYLNGDTASVKVKQTMAGDVGTADMATWMLWAEVEKGLDYTWTIGDQIQPTVGEKY